MLLQEEGQRYVEIEYESVDVKTKNQVGFFHMEELNEICALFEIDETLFEEFRLERATKYESYDEFFMLGINEIDKEHMRLSSKRVYVYQNKHACLIFCDSEQQVHRWIAEFQKSEHHGTIAQISYHLLKSSVQGDLHMLERMEKHISDLENALISNRAGDCVKDIIKIRRKLMKLNNHYEQLVDLLEDVLENENELFDESTLQLVKILSDRVERLNQRVGTLREYVTQVREAYQAQVDINLNRTMQFFTVVTTIFLPLTLIVGWYGMNLQMPETKWRYSYLLVILISIAVVVVCMRYFKKKKWF